MDGAGNLYGTAYAGGRHGTTSTGGSIFELQFTGTGYKYNLLHSFCARSSATTECTDGEFPKASLIIDAQGNLYGTTSQGGAYGHGTVFELLPNSDHTIWSLQVLHDFCPDSPTCAAGQDPLGALTYQGAQTGALYDGNSPLYGVTDLGGGPNEAVAFSLTKIAGKVRRKATVIHQFCAGGGACPNGTIPKAGLLFDSSGNLFGTTSSGGRYGTGGVFELSPAGQDYSFVVLYDFCARVSSNGGCADGGGPESSLVRDAAGNLFGTTSYGGAYDDGTRRYGGVLFSLAPAGFSSKETVLHSFCDPALIGCTGSTDGHHPASAPVIDSGGSIFGTTRDGGRFGGGTVYRVSGAKYAIVHNFCSQSGCQGGAQPSGDLLLGPNGRLFGVTQGGGKSGYGTVFELTP